jgi:MFS family permease
MFGGMAVVAGANMAVFPLFPALQEAHGLSTSSLGVLAAAGFLSSMIVELFVSPYADRGHARLMTFLGVLAMSAALVTFALADATWQFVGGRALTGVGYGLFVPSVAAVLIRRDPGRAGESLGKLNTADLSGLAVGPLLASVVLYFTDASTTLWLLAVLTAAVAVPVARSVPSEPHTVVAPGSGPRLALDLLGSKAVIGAALLTVAVFVPIGAYDSIWPRFMADIGANELLIGFSYTAFAIPFVLVATPAGRMADRIGGSATFVRGIGVLLVCIGSYAVLRDPWLVSGVGFVESTGQAIAFSASAAAMAQVVAPERAGAGQGLARAGGTLAASVTSIISAWVYADTGPGPMFIGTVVVTAAVVVVSLVLLPRRRFAAGELIADAVTAADDQGPSTRSAESASASATPEARSTTVLK